MLLLVFVETCVIYARRTVLNRGHSLYYGNVNQLPKTPTLKLKLRCSGSFVRHHLGYNHASYSEFGTFSRDQKFSYFSLLSTFTLQAMSSGSKSQVPLVVLGAGVIGLTVAYLAACDSDVSFDITIIARDMPGDWDSQAWSSPFAVCSFQSSLKHFLTGSYLGCELVSNVARCHG